MFSKSSGLSFLGSTLAHGALLFGAGNLHTPARVEVLPAPTAMELILSQGTSGETLRRHYVAPQNDAEKTEDDTKKETQEDVLKATALDNTEKKTSTDTTKTLSVAQPQPVLMRYPQELQSSDEGSHLKQRDPSALPQDDAKKSPGKITHAQPIAGEDIGATQIGSSFPTHGACIEQNFPPKYPRWARRQGWEGSALLKVSISKEGQAQKVSLEKSSGHAILDEAAVNAVAQWKFHPAKQLGVSVPSELLVPIVFQIKG